MIRVFSASESTYNGSAGTDFMALSNMFVYYLNPPNTATATDGSKVNIDWLVAHEAEHVYEAREGHTTGIDGHIDASAVHTAHSQQCSGLSQ